MKSKDGVTLSLGTLAAEFGMSRDVLRRILAEASVHPVDRRGGHPVYRLAAVFRAVQRQSDPASMPAHSKLALARAAIAEDELRRRRGELCERADVEIEIARLVKLFASSLERLPDRLEATAGASAQQLEAIDELIDRLRLDLFEQVTGTKPKEDENESTHIGRTSGVVRERENRDREDSAGSDG